jgi:hypothetical protein
MRVQSIWTMIEARDPAGDGFLHTACQMSLGKMDGIAEAHDLAEEIRAMAEALEYAGDVLPSRVSTPFVIDLGDLSGRIGIFNQVDFRLGGCHRGPTHST